jgi:outer membrane biosynthesis protein TonB
MGGGNLSDQQLKEFDEYLSNSGVKQPAADDATDDVADQPAQPAPPPPPASRPAPVPAPAPEPEVEEEEPEPAPAPALEPEPAPVSPPPVDDESYLDDIITLHEQKADDILDLLDKIDAKSHKDIVADLVDEMQYQKGVIRREQEQADNLKQLFRLAADATK